MNLEMAMPMPTLPLHACDVLSTAELKPTRSSASSGLKVCFLLSFNLQPFQPSSPYHLENAANYSSFILLVEGRIVLWEVSAIQQLALMSLCRGWDLEAMKEGGSVQSGLA